MESVTAQGGGYISTIDKNQRELNAARKAEARSTTFNLGNTKTTYISQANSMGEHKITEDDVVNSGQNLQLQKERMRKANFKLPYT